MVASKSLLNAFDVDCIELSALLFQTAKIFPIEQIKQKNYPQKFRVPEKDLIAIGIEFCRKIRSIKSFEWILERVGQEPETGIIKKKPVVRETTEKHRSPARTKKMKRAR